MNRAAIMPMTEEGSTPRSVRRNVLRRISNDITIVSRSSLRRRPVMVVSV